MPEFALILIRSVFAFVLLFFMSRLMGKKQISQLTFFDYCVGITIGSIASSMSVDQNVKISNGVTSLIIWGLFPILLSYGGMKSRKFLRLTDGKPAILIKNGEVQEDLMKKNAVTIEELILLLRNKGIFSIADVEMAVWETNGQLSVMQKKELQPVTPKILGIPVEKDSGPVLLVADGEVIASNLAVLGYSREWLLGEIQKQGGLTIEDVFLAQVDSKGDLYVDFYREKNKRSQIPQRPLLAAEIKKLQADLESFSLQTDDPQAKKMYAEQAKKLQQTIDSLKEYLK